LKILLTGATSLTGLWFVRELKSQGHEIICLLTRESAASYANLKSKDRFALLQHEIRIEYASPFGSEKFIHLLHSEKPDLLCLHGSHIPDYKSQTFNIAESLAQNLYNIHNVVRTMQEYRLPVILTGTLFEPLADEPDAASPYGLAKGLVTQTWRYYASKAEIPLRHFVIPNPFGVYEDKKFNHYLIDSWINGRKAQIKTPDYVRDNIPVTLLAKAYAAACTQTLTQAKPFTTSRPSGYVSTQADFTVRMAEWVRNLTGLACEFEFLVQSDFSEPIDRHNHENAFKQFRAFDEKEFWQTYIESYPRP